MILFLLSRVRVVQASLLLIINALLLLVNHCFVLSIFGEFLRRESFGLLAQISPYSLKLFYLFSQLIAFWFLLSNSCLSQLLILV